MCERLCTVSARAERQGRTADLLSRLDFLILDELGYVNAYVKQNKNYANDAEAICEAVIRHRKEAGAPPHHAAFSQ